MKLIVSSFTVVLCGLWCIYAYPNEPPQNTAQMHDQLRYESDIRLPVLHKIYIFLRTFQGLKSKADISVHKAAKIRIKKEWLGLCLYKMTEPLNTKKQFGGLTNHTYRTPTEI